MEFFGINPNLPVSEEDFERIRTFVWTARRNDQRRMVEAAKDAKHVSRGLGSAVHSGVPESPPEEILLWAMSQRSLLIGAFKPQVQVGPYFLDFGFEAEKLGVEVDGRAHHSSPADRARDSRRAAYLAKCGWTLLRFAASEIFKDAHTAADKITRQLGILQKQKGIKEAWEREA